MKKKGHGFNMIMITWVMKKCLRKCGSYLQIGELLMIFGC